ncbi:MAG: 2,4-dihydroxyhept-2-ene-1,7-dioic acid aldolase [Proteobacteria bacterium]|nr:2,4-dihydroxyhept-2-ene-1,7-dioic acid aldolase [Pseudomonadota bacterium]MBI3496959.1 2,4-dihydroxyhept-2-ene-1,7-dioic acid aldolase [Pseudomonadota bacterium]
MRENRVKTIWQNGGVVVAGACALDSLYAAEVMAHEGFDALIIDTQHAAIDYKDTLAMMQVISATQSTPIVRVGWNTPNLVMRMLDAGAYGVICPMINTRADCEAFVGACLYAPRGYRSYGPIRGGFYGGPDYLDRANDTILPMIQIETAVAVERADEILSVPGLGGIYLGPGDLSITLGLDPRTQMDDTRLWRAIERVLASCVRNKVLPGLYTPNAAWARRAIDLGARLITAGADVGFIRAGAQQSLAAFRAIAG